MNEDSSTTYSANNKNDESLTPTVDTLSQINFTPPVGHLSPNEKTTMEKLCNSTSDKPREGARSHVHVANDVMHNMSYKQCHALHERYIKKLLSMCYGMVNEKVQFDLENE